MAEVNPTESKVPSDTPSVTPKYTDVPQDNLTEQHLNEINGVIQTLSTTPTGKARRMSEQFKIITGGALAFFDTVASVWYTLRTSYGGAFDSAGTAGTPFPTGWTVSKTGTGTYLITHNLGTTSYTVAATPLGFYNIVQVASRQSTTFELYAVDRGTGAASNTAMNFILTLD